MIGNEMLYSVEANLIHQRHAHFLAFVYSAIYIVATNCSRSATNCSRRATTLEDDLEAFLEEFFDEKVMNGKMNMYSTPWCH